MIYVKKYIKKIVDIINKPELRILPGHLAFFLVLSIIPIIVLCGYIASLFNLSLDTIINFMNKTLPLEVVNILLPFITGHGMDLNIGFSMLVGYFLASNGVNSIIISCNILYNTTNNNNIKRRIKALFITILLVTLFVFTLFVLAFGNNILKLIMSFKIFNHLNNSFYFLFSILKWPIAILFIYFIIKIIFTIAPDSVNNNKYTKKGALFTTFAWIISTFIYSYYVSNFSNYDIFYGSLSSIIVMMMWIYILSYAFVIGIAINVNTYNMKKNR